RRERHGQRHRRRDRARRSCSRDRDRQEPQVADGCQRRNRDLHDPGHEHGQHGAVERHGFRPELARLQPLARNPRGGRPPPRPHPAPNRARRPRPPHAPPPRGPPAPGATVPATDTADVTVPAAPAPAIAIAKSPKSQTVTSGGTATFGITVTNTGNVTLT